MTKLSCRIYVSLPLCHTLNVSSNTYCHPSLCHNHRLIWMRRKGKSTCNSFTPCPRWLLVHRTDAYKHRGQLQQRWRHLTFFLFVIVVYKEILMVIGRSMASNLGGYRRDGSSMRTVLQLLDLRGLMNRTVYFWMTSIPGSCSTPSPSYMSRTSGLSMDNSLTITGPQTLNTLRQ